MTTRDAPEPKQPRASAAETRRILEMSVRNETRAVDNLITRLLRDDGEEWLARGLDRAYDQPAGFFALLCEGEAGLPVCKATKSRGTAMFSSPDRDDTLFGLAGYFLAVAAALATHGVLISEQPRESFDEIFVELATVMPRPFGDVLLRASESESGS